MSKGETKDGNSKFSNKYNCNYTKFNSSCGINSKNLNKKMLNEVLKSTYYKAIITDSIAKGNDGLAWGKDGFTVKYNYYTKNNIVAIYINIIENSSESFPGSGDGVNHFNYFYDINNDKELSFDDGVNKMGIKDYVIDGWPHGKILLIENGKLLKEYKEI